MDRPPVLLDDGVDDGKPEAVPFAFVVKNGFEDVLHHVVRDPAAGVAHLENHPDPLRGVGEVRGDGEDAAPPHRLDGVGYEVPHHLPDLVRIREDDREVRERSIIREMRASSNSSRNISSTSRSPCSGSRRGTRGPSPGEVERLV